MIVYVARLLLASAMRHRASDVERLVGAAAGRVRGRLAAAVGHGIRRVSGRVALCGCTRDDGASCDGDVVEQLGEPYRRANPWASCPCGCHDLIAALRAHERAA